MAYDLIETGLENIMGKTNITRRDFLAAVSAGAVVLASDGSVGNCRLTVSLRGAHRCG